MSTLVLTNLRNHANFTISHNRKEKIFQFCIRNVENIENRKIFKIEKYIFIIRSSIKVYIIPMVYNCSMWYKQANSTVCT